MIACPSERSALRAAQPVRHDVDWRGYHVVQFDLSLNARAAGSGCEDARRWAVDRSDRLVDDPRPL